MFARAIEPEPQLDGWARRTVAAWRTVADCRDGMGGGIDWPAAERVLALYGVRLTARLHFLLRALHGYLIMAEEADRD